MPVIFQLSSSVSFFIIIYQFCFVLIYENVYLSSQPATVFFKPQLFLFGWDLLYEISIYIGRQFVWELVPNLDALCYLSFNPHTDLAVELHTGYTWSLRYVYKQTNILSPNYSSNNYIVYKKYMRVYFFNYWILKYFSWNVRRVYQSYFHVQTITILLEFAFNYFIIIKHFIKPYLLF